MENLSRSNALPGQSTIRTMKTQPPPPLKFFATARYEYMTAYIESAKQVGRLENAIGWYHSHPGERGGGHSVHCVHIPPSPKPGLINRPTVSYL